MNKKTLFILIVSAVVLITAFVLQIKRNFFDTNIVTPAPIVSSIVPTQPVMQTPVVTSTPELTIEQKNLLEEYLKQNLSLLSPKQEVLGGKFYLTEFIIKDYETADIAYEDGHISFDAEIKFTFNNNLPQITSFVITKENGQAVTTSTIISSTTSSTLPSE